MYRTIVIFFIICLTSTHVLSAQEGGHNPSLPAAFKYLNRSTPWKRVAEITVQFDTYHPQGFTLIDNYLFVSSVEILERTERFPELIDGLDRSAGTGKGHLFKMDLEGALIDRVELGEGAMYHPGGIDFDGTHIWIPVAEYRPNSASIIYKVDPEALTPHKVFSVADHIGGIVHDVDSGLLHGVSWGSRRLYAWTMHGEPFSGKDFVQNPAHYIDYQDCEYAGEHTAICSGLAGYYNSESEIRMSLGGMELIDLENHLPLHQIPFPYWTESGLPMTQNPVYLEATEFGLRVYAMPEDNKSRIFIYEATLNTSN